MDRESPATPNIVVTAVVTRKDGTVEDLGVVAEGKVGFDAASPGGD